MLCKYLIIIMFGFLLTLWGCGEPDQEENLSREIPVRTEKVIWEEISIPIHTSGILSPAKELRLSFKTGGIIRQIFVEEGQEVEKGELLARLNLSEINASLKQAQTAFEKRQRDFSRVEKLYRDSVATLEQYQDARTALEVAEAQLEVARFNHRHSEIYAPSRGKILKQFMDEDEMVSPGSPVILFGATNQRWIIRVGLTDRDIVKIQIGDSAGVRLDAYPGKNFSGEVTEVGDAPNPMNGTYEVEVSLNPISEKLASGFVAKLDIFPPKQREFAIIPPAALVEAEGKRAFVFAPSDSGNSVNKMPIHIADILDDRIIVSGGLEGVESIVTSGSQYLTQGVRIKINE